MFAPERERARRQPEENGFSLVELCLVIVLVGLSAAALVNLLDGEMRRARRHAERLETAEAIRTGATVLGAELRWIHPAADLHAFAADSLALRVFRGIAVVCDIGGEAVTVLYRGIRAPEPAKDSLVASLAAAHSPPMALAHSALALPGTCDALHGERVYRWRLDWGLVGEPAKGDLLLLFEAGSYHLSGRALRYRRGAAGRQPLTPEVFNDAETGFAAVDVSSTPAAAPSDAAAIVVKLATFRRNGSPAPSPPFRLRIALLNHGLH